MLDTESAAFKEYRESKFSQAMIKIEYRYLHQDNSQGLFYEPEDAITMAEYEKVVKGARLTDPVEEPISRTCTSWITCLCPNTPPSDGFLFGCYEHQIHQTNSQRNEQTLHTVKGVGYNGICNVLQIGSLTVICSDGVSVHIYEHNVLKKQTVNVFSDRLHNSNSHNDFEPDSQRGCRVSQRMLYFSRGEGKDKRGKIVRVNLDTFEEVVLDKLADNIADFLVDENQTITYLTSQGELRQENPDNSSIPKTCVNLKTDSTTGGQWTSLCRVGQNEFISTFYREKFIRSE